MSLLASRQALVLAVLLSEGCAWAREVFFDKDGGARPDDSSWDTVLKNGAALNKTLASLEPGDTLVVPAKTFYLMGGIKVSGLTSVTIRIDGTLYFDSGTLNAQRYMKAWPRSQPGSNLKAKVLECMHFQNVRNVTFTSSSQGMLNGAGSKWWGVPGIGYLLREENRPRLLKIESGKDILVENLFLKDSPYWTFNAVGVQNIEVRYSKVEARRTKREGHGIIDLTAFNTDGFDFNACDNVWVHDSDVWNQDDCFDVKSGTKNVVIERVNATGLGLTIGSIQGEVKNVTFRNAYMHKPYKGIYMKFRGSGHVSDVLYENIVIDQPAQFAIWIGPAQQCDGCSLTELCSTKGGPCSICWPTVGQCHGVENAFYRNITLRNVTVLNPKQSAGALIADKTSPMKNIVFEDVVVKNPASKPFGADNYKCDYVNGVAKGKTYPVPPCMKDMTDANAADRGSETQLVV